MWATSHRYALDGRVARVQSATEATAATIADALGDALPGSDRRAPDVVVSVRLEPPVTHGSQPLHLVYADGCLHARTHDPRRAIAATITVARGTPPRDDVVLLDACALVGPRGAVLLPAGARPHVVMHERRLNRHDVLIVDAPAATIDPATGHLVVEAAPEVRAALDDLYRGSERGAALPGVHPVRAWVLDELAGANDVRRQPGVELVTNIDAVRPWRARAVLTRVELGARLLRTWDPWPDDLVAAVVELTAEPA